MDEMITIELRGVDKPEDLLILQIMLMTLEGVEDVGMLDDTEPTKIGLCVELESHIFAAARTAASLIERIINLVNEQGIDGATLRMGDAAIEIDHVSTEQIESMLGASTEPDLPRS
jgi:hypothetical protein